VTVKFLNYYLADSSRLPQLEQAILHLDPMKLDLNVMLPTVRQVRLFTALEHIYNRALNDFATPISDVAGAIILGLGFHSQQQHDQADGEQPLPSLDGQRHQQPSADTDAFGLQLSGDADMDAVEEERVAIGARLPALSASDRVEQAFSLFLYIDYAFTGRWFPRGNDLPDLWFNGVKAQILSVLFAPSAKLTAKKNTAPVPLPSYPWLSFFLNVSCKHTLSAVGNAFDSQDWTVYIDQWSAEEDRSEQQGGHTQATLAVPGDELPAIPIPEGESLPEEFLQQQQQQQQQQQASSDAYGDVNGGQSGREDTSFNTHILQTPAQPTTMRPIVLRTHSFNHSFACAFTWCGWFCARAICVWQCWRCGRGSPVCLRCAISSGDAGRSHRAHHRPEADSARRNRAVVQPVQPAPLSLPSQGRSHEHVTPIKRTRTNTNTDGANCRVSNSVVR